MSMRVTFFGAAGTVTGSKYLLEIDTPTKPLRLLIDAGMFQGSRPWQEKNWETFDELRLREIDACLLTHAHIDHTGLLPRLWKLGLRCPVFCTPPTLDMTKLLLLDSAELQEEEARYRAKEKASRYDPPQPLYQVADAQNALRNLRAVPFNQPTEILPGVRVSFAHMGHILGAASIAVEAFGKRACFSGDIGRYGVPILKDPEPIEAGDLLLMESTYGDKDHGGGEQAEFLAGIVNETHDRRGVLVIPSFAVGRAQLLLYLLRELKSSRRIPDLPVVIDSPMAEDATALYARYPSDYDEEALGLRKGGQSPFRFSKLGFTKDRNQSKKLNEIDEPMIIIAASGMLSGGRILHHLVRRISHPSNTILFVGHQPPGGKGDLLLKGAERIRFFKKDFVVRAQIRAMSGASAHAGRSELLRWAASISGVPGRVAVVHGEPAVAKGFAEALRDELKWNSFAAAYKQVAEI